ncbi:MAG: molybdopterin molybdotransferase MoeA [Methanobacterium sp.]|nr:molybdopterin molybdotransferase MoeA [Methanobacterium sp.]
MFLSELIPLQQALKIITDTIKPTPLEKTTLENAYKRVIGEDIFSQLDSPPFDRSAMDGYALKAQDTFGSSQQNPAHLTVVDRIGAGHTSPAIIRNGEAVKIATGAPIPQGADAVVMEEYTQEQGDNLKVESSLTPGENISFKGEDIKKEEVIINKGRYLQPQDMAIIASGGYKEVNVHQKPRVGVLITGSELVMPSPNISGAEVINSNHYTIKALVESSMAIPTLSHVEDHAEKVKNKFESILKSHDALITTGGTAISKGDVVVEVSEELGELMFHGVAMRPGKPFAFAIVHDKPVFMLSGYPVAAMVQFDVLVRENLLKLQNLHRPPVLTRKIATRKIPSTLGRTDYIRAKTDGVNVTPLNIKGSTMIHSMVSSNCYIVIEENLEGVAAGENCDVLLYDSMLV